MIIDKVINEKIEFIDYPYIGLGERPSNNNVHATDEQLEKLSY